jgi:hypothetical protein
MGSLADFNAVRPRISKALLGFNCHDGNHINGRFSHVEEPP